MERDHGLGSYTIRQPQCDPAHLVASSPFRAVDRIQAEIVRGQSGPVVITGEPGAGKTWAARSLAAALPDHWRTAVVDLAAAMNALDFHRLIAHGIGVTGS